MKRRKELHAEMMLERSAILSGVFLELLINKLKQVRNSLDPQVQVENYKTVIQSEPETIPTRLSFLNDKNMSSCKDSSV